MPEAEIQYFIPKEARRLGDTEFIANAIGAYHQEVPETANIQQTTEFNEVDGGAVMIRFIRMIQESRFDYELLEIAAQMQRGVEKHFPDVHHARLAGHFVGIDTPGATKTE